MKDLNNEPLHNFLKPFTESCKNVFKTMVRTDINLSAPTPKDNSSILGEYCSSIGLNGKIVNSSGEKFFKGQFVFSCPKNVIVNIANELLMDKHEDFSEEIKDVGSEIVNMILGNAKKTLNPLGYKLEMSIPTVILGNTKIAPPNSCKAITIPIESKLGNMQIDLCFNTLQEEDVEIIE